MNVIKDLLRKKSTESSAPAVEPDKSPPKPANILEQTVNDALPIPVQLKKTEDQLRLESLQTMAYLEAAREEKGNFCLTLGEGDERTVLLVAPVEGAKAEDLVKSDFGRADYTFAVTRTDYVLLTARGPRRISFSQTDPNPLYQGNELKERNEKVTQDEGKFKRIVDQLAKKGEVHLKNSGYSEYRSEYNGMEDVDVDLSIGIPGSTADRDNFKKNTKREGRAQFSNSNDSGIITDDATPLQAIKNSLNSVQSPLRAKMVDARAQIQSVGAIRQGLE